MLFHNMERETAACIGIDTELFYLEQNMEAAAMHRKLAPICASCPLLVQCRDHAIRHELFGYWGGTSAADRKEIRRRMGIVVSRPELDAHAA